MKNSLRPKSAPLIMRIIKGNTTMDGINQKSLFNFKGSTLNPNKILHKGFLIKNLITRIHKSMSFKFLKKWRL